MKGWMMGGALAVAMVVGAASRTVEGPRIAVVDLSRLVSQHRDSKEAIHLIDQWFTTNKSLMDERLKGYKANVAELDSYKPGSDEFMTKTRALRIQKASLEAEQEALQDEYERRVGRSLADAHAHVVAACNTYLESRDLDAVFQFNSNPVPGATRGEVIPEIVVRTLVAHRKTIDATDAVLAILDAGK